MGDMSNHVYIDEPVSKYFEESEILNAATVEGRRKKRDSFILLASYGYYVGFKSEFVKSKSEASDIAIMSQFDDEQLALLYAIALDDSNDPKVIMDDKKVMKIAMDYANTALITLKDIEKNSPLNQKMNFFRFLIKDAYSEIYEDN